ncbi:hypothetical protein SLEP1_g28389 [Rubroshorea leprosula]|uniref:DUF1677 family protein n=1 Tax=Rubroshorea leprosula TaxID=152421 RepID=A0AAV5K009_9ROSI|nr:hypothetical protein SLEP1_g28389 [Rubroshorea leprosula]
MAFSGTETQPPLIKLTPLTEIQSVKCDCCCFTEECTPAYIHRIQESYQGRWICGLCVEAVKDMVQRSHTAISTEEALDRHISFCKEFRASSPPAETEHPIIVISRLLRRRLEYSPRMLHSNSSRSFPNMEGVKASTGLLRSESCFPAQSK